MLSATIAAVVVVVMPSSDFCSTLVVAVVFVPFPLLSAFLSSSFAFGQLPFLLSVFRFLRMLLLLPPPKNALRPAFIWCLVPICRVSTSLRLAAYGHTLHLYGFSSVCVRRCVRKWSEREKNRPQQSQQNGFSPVCRRRCRDRMSGRRKSFSQYRQMNCSSSCCSCSSAQFSTSISSSSLSSSSTIVFSSSSSFIVPPCVVANNTSFFDFPFSLSLSNKTFFFVPLLSFFDVSNWFNGGIDLAARSVNFWRCCSR